MIPISFSNVALHPDRIREDDGSLDKLFVRLVYGLFIGEHPFNQRGLLASESRSAQIGNIMRGRRQAHLG